MIDPAAFRIDPGSNVDLSAIPSRVDDGLDKDDAKRELDRLHERFQVLQEMLFAESRRSVLVVLQAMDTAGKDSTIRSVFGPLNPQGVRVWSFKAPTENERGHDFLWRVHRRVPGAGCIGVFNRSHYEDVLIVRVKNLAPRDVWERRYEHINAFEKLLVDEGTVVLKFYLHISKDYQQERLQRRLDNPDKHWKFNPADLKERARWDDYMRAYEDALSRCSPGHAPWYVIPAERRWFRNLAIARILVDTLTQMDLRFPTADFDPATIEIE